MVQMRAICRANHNTHVDIQPHSKYSEIIVCDAYFVSIKLHTETRHRTLSIFLDILTTFKFPHFLDGWSSVV